MSQLFLSDIVALHSNYDKCHESITYLLHFFLTNKGFAFNHKVEGPNIGFAGCEMRVNMNAEYRMTELSMAGGENGICPLLTDRIRDRRQDPGCKG